MNAYLVDQTQQMERAKTFAEIRRIEERVSRTAQAKPEVRRRAVWPFGARLPAAALPCRVTPLSRREVPVEARVIGGATGIIELGGVSPSAVTAALRAAMLGPSGAGRTPAGSARRNAGFALDPATLHGSDLGGQPACARARAARAPAGLVLVEQGRAVFGSLTIAENIRAAGGRHGPG